MAARIILPVVCSDPSFCRLLQWPFHFALPRIFENVTNAKSYTLDRSSSLTNSDSYNDYFVCFLVFCLFSITVDVTLLPANRRTTRFTSFEYTSRLNHEPNALARRTWQWCCSTTSCAPILSRGAMVRAFKWFTTIAITQRCCFCEARFTLKRHKCLLCLHLFADEQSSRLILVRLPVCNVNSKNDKMSTADSPIWPSFSSPP